MEKENTDDVLMIAQQGMFSSGGIVTEPVEGEYDPTSNWLDASRAGNTAHVDHANVFYQIPVNDNGNPIVYLLPVYFALHLRPFPALSPLLLPALYQPPHYHSLSVRILSAILPAAL